jgi:hypothetical protein
MIVIIKNKNLPMKIFLSHSSKDKEFVRHIANDLQTYDLPVWFDEWEIKVGDSLTQKISDGINESGWLIIVLSENSINSKWVQNEINAAMTIELEKKEVFILPILIDDCKIPILLRDKLYADFRKSYTIGIKSLLNKFGTNQYCSKVFEFPEKIRLKKNKKSLFNFRYNLLINSNGHNIQPLMPYLYGLMNVEDLRIVVLEGTNYNIYLHCNSEIDETLIENSCQTYDLELVKITKYRFNPGIEKMDI